MILVSQLSNANMTYLAADTCKWSVSLCNETKCCIGNIWIHEADYSL